MVSLFLGVVLAGFTSEQAVQQDYAKAYRDSISEGKPLLVIVGAPWCPACQTLKEATILPMAQTGELDDVSVALINKDQDPQLAKELTGGEPMIPQIILYTSEQGKWKRRKLMGYQPKQPVRNLIRRALGRG